MEDPFSNEIRKIMEQKKKFATRSDAILSLILGIKFVLILSVFATMGYFLTLDELQKNKTMDWLVKFHVYSTVPLIYHAIIFIGVFAVLITFSGGLRLFLIMNLWFTKFISNQIISLVNRLDMYFWKKHKKDSMATNALMKYSGYMMRYRKYFVAGLIILVAITQALKFL